MKAVLEILRGIGIDPSKPPHREARLSIRNSPWMPLHIEAIGDGPAGGQAWSVAHYGRMNGDLMRDPDICFEMQAGAMVPFSFRNDYAGLDIEIPAAAPINDPRRLDIDDFARMWSENLYDQGFVKAALPVRSESSRKRRDHLGWLWGRLHRIHAARRRGTETWRQRARSEQIAAVIRRLQPAEGHPAP